VAIKGFQQDRYAVSHADVSKLAEMFHFCENSTIEKHLYISEKEHLLPLEPTTIELVARARGDLRMGVPVGLRRGDTTTFYVAVETVSQERFSEVAGGAYLVITEKRATTLKARAYDGDICRVSLPENANLRWVKAVADPAQDLAFPMKGPFSELRDGDASADRLAIRLCKDARLLPSVLAWDGSNQTASNLTILNIAELSKLSAERVYSEVVQANLPLEVSEAAKLHVFRPDDGGEEHYGVEIGSPDRSKPVLSRLHSACFTGDLLGSLKCDCGPQLRIAMEQIGENGAGVLLYLNQEGRGIGLANKMRAYRLQDQGFDTVDANHRLGFEDEERDFRVGAALLKQMGFSSVRLMTNNPAKVSMMSAAGVDVVERVPLIVGHSRHNEKYLATKAKKSGHLL
jgi:GTP cyclohydrolase II